MFAISRNPASWIINPVNVAITKIARTAVINAFPILANTQLFFFLMALSNIIFDANLTSLFPQFGYH